MQKFQGENIPSKTFKYLQYITQEELHLEAEERKNRGQQAAPVPEVQPVRPVSSNQMTFEPRQTSTTMNPPKPVMGQPISFANSSLNRDRGQVHNMTNASNTFHPTQSSQSIFSLKNQSNSNPTYQFPMVQPNSNLTYQPPMVQSSGNLTYQPSMTQPNSNLTYQAPKVQSSSCSIDRSTAPPSTVFKEDVNESVEFSFLPSEASCNETSFTFNNIFKNDESQEEPEVTVVEVKTTGKYFTWTILNYDYCTLNLISIIQKCQL